MNANFSSVIRLSGRRNVVISCAAGMKMLENPIEFGPIVFPPGEQNLLPPVPKAPFFDPGKREVAKYATKRLIEIRGPELVHTKLVHRQYGLRAKLGGFLHHHHFESIRKSVNPRLDDKTFAIWRVDPPWLPRTKVPQGMKLGGGKRSIHHYVTPVRAGRIIVELGGHVTVDQALRMLCNAAKTLPMPAEMVSQADLAEEEEREKFIAENNLNKFTWEYIMKWNMQNCYRWLSPYDYIWKGRYR
uniref:Large ribosomal subunit protein uL16m n=1 Tax=Trichuris muris TaxID=70415 RepID=A0A5S6QCL9_TRIMR